MSLSERLIGFPLAVKRSIRNGLRLTLSGDSNGVTAIFMKNNIVIGALMLIVGIVGGWLCRGYHFREEVKMVQKDTIVYRDTIRETYPIEISKEVVRKEYVVVRDTLRIKDTLYLSLPMERRVYGSDDFYAEVTGYNPSLDYIEVFPKTKVVTKYVKGQERWRFSLDAGMDVGKGRQAYIAPNIGAEMGYMRWSVTAEAGLDFSMTQAVIPYYQIGLRYAIIQR